MRMSYWKCNIKRTLPLFITISVIALIIPIVFAIGLSASINTENTYIPNSNTYTFAMILFYLASAIAIMMPFNFHSKIWHKRSTDIYLSLPVNRNDIFFGDYLLGLAEAIIPFLLAFSIGFFIIPLAAKGLWMNASLVFGSMGLTILGILIVYSLSFGISYFANNSLDAILFLAFSSFVPVIFYSFFASAFSSFTKENVPFFFTLFQNIYPESGIQNLISYLSNPTEATNTMYFEKWMSVLFSFVVALAFMVGAYFHFKGWKAEEAGKVSTSIFGYYFWVEIAFFSVYEYITLAFWYSQVPFYFIIFIVLAIVYVIILFISKRKIAFASKDFIVWGAVYFSATILGVILNAIKFS